MTDYIKLATRKSPLALKQANIVKEYLLEKNIFRGIKLIPMSTSGDTVDAKTFKREGGKGLFLKELEKLLIEGEADIAVHSMKDVPAILNSQFQVSSIMKREDPCDVFISNKYKCLDDIIDGTIGSSSPRRQAMIKNKNKNITTVEVRGNINTRLEKIANNKMDAIILAKAGLNRMNIKPTVTEDLSLDEFVPSPGQGILCIEYLKSNVLLKRKLKNISHEDTEICGMAERIFAAKMDGDCLSPIGAYADINNNMLTITGYVASLDGKRFIKNKISGNKKDFSELSCRLSEVFINMGSKGLIKC